MDDIRDIFKKLDEMAGLPDTIKVDDNFDIELSEHFVIETTVCGFTEDGVIVESDESMLEFLDLNGVLLEDDLDESKYKGTELEVIIDLFFFFGHNPNEINPITSTEELIAKNLLDQFFKDTNNESRYFNLDEEKMQIAWLANQLKVSQRYIKQSVNSIELLEAEYQGRKVELNKPMAGDVAKFKVYVKDPSTGNVKKVNFGQKGVKIKKSNPARRKSFRARHKCDTAKDKTTARYWSCRKW